MKKWLLSFVAILLVAGCAQPSVKSKLTKIAILHTNDVHGHVWAFKAADGTMRGGFAAQAQLIKKIRKEMEEKGGITLVLSGGDVNTGVPDSDLLSAEPDFRGMNLIGYDGMVLGNHDFDGGLDKLFQQKAWATFPMLSANVIDKKTKLSLVEPFVIIERKNVRFGIVGLTTDQLSKLVLPQNVSSLEVTDPVKEAERRLPMLKEKGANILIALTHLGVESTGANLNQIATTDNDLAEKVPDFHVIVGGHSHTLLEKGTRVGNTLIVQAGEKGQHLGRVDLEWDSQKLQVVSATASTLPIVPSQGEDEAVKNALAPFQEKVAKILDQKIGESRVFLDGERERLRHQETNLGNLICDVLRKKTKADIAIYNGGGIRASIQQGPVLLRDVYRALPFRNTVVTATITGKQLKEALETGIKHQHVSGSFLQVSGLRYVIQQNTLKKVLVKGKPVKDQDRFKIATNNFLVAGGDYFDVLQTAKNINDLGIPVEEYVAAYFKENSPVQASVEKRIQTIH